jgi:uncharacterized membrane protein
MNNRDLTQLHSVARRRHTARVIRGWVWRSMLPIPCAYIAGAIVLGAAAPALDHGLGVRLDQGVGIAAARDILTSTATGMIAFTGLVVSSVLVLVQFAAGQYGANTGQPDLRTGTDAIAALAIESARP